MLHRVLYFQISISFKQPILRFTLFFLYIELLLVQIPAQVVTTLPPIFTDSEEVIITFDATKGSGGLKDFPGEVYAHTGVITNQSNSDSDWKYVLADWGTNLPKAKLTRIATNIYTFSIRPSVRSFYNVPGEETIEKLAFVFRSADGLKEGKDDGGKDIFVTIGQPGLSVKIIHPRPNQIFAPGDTVAIEVSVKDHDSISIKINNQHLLSDTASNLKTYFLPSLTGLYLIEVAAYSHGDSITETLAVYIRSDSPTALLPSDARKGITILSDSSARLVLFAPHKQFAFVLGDFNNWQPDGNYQMYRDSNYFWLDINGLVPEREYAFQYYIDGSLYLADPYSNKILDPWNDKNIASATFPGLMPYPLGKGNGIVSVFCTQPENYKWVNTNFISPRPEQLSIYELLIRDFTLGPDGKEGNTFGVLSKLNYLDSLGINTVELMPFNEFEGNDSWGYNPSFYFATDKAYGSSSDYKSLIDSLHGRGIAVIQDIVLNHSYGQSPFVQMYFEVGAPSFINPWYNVSSPNPVYSWGFDFNHQSTYTQELVDSILRYWVQEYRVDGFRFDFTKGFTNQPGDGWAFDGTRIGILRRIASRIREVKPDIILILEHLTENREEQILADDGFLLWGNMNHAYNEATMGYTEDRKSDLSGISYHWRDFRKPGIVGYMESHDEERLMYKNLLYGNNQGDYDIKVFPTGLERNALATAFFLTIPGPKMIWQFGELGYDFSIDYNGRVGRKPVRWDYADDPDRRKLLATYKYLLHLRHSQALFSTDSFVMEVADALKTIRLTLGDTTLIVAGNFGMVRSQYLLRLPVLGNWYELTEGKSIWFPTLESVISLDRGEFRIYSNQPMPVQNQFDHSTDTSSAAIKVYPNPSDNYFIFALPNPEPILLNLDIYDFQGRLVCQPYSNLSLKGPTEILWDADAWVKPGLFLAKLTVNGSYTTLPILKK